MSISLGQQEPNVIPRITQANLRPRMPKIHREVVSSEKRVVGRAISLGEPLGEGYYEINSQGDVLKRDVAIANLHHARPPRLPLPQGRTETETIKTRRDHKDVRDPRDRHGRDMSDPRN